MTDIRVAQLWMLVAQRRYRAGQRAFGDRLLLRALVVLARSGGGH